MKYLLILLVVACIGAFAYDRLTHGASFLKSGTAQTETSAPLAAPSTASEWRPPARTAPAQAAAHASGCDGRTHCSHMRSCSDAKAHMHCPGAAMDGDRDGIPCERQWCE